MKLTPVEINVQAKDQGELLFDLKDDPASIKKLLEDKEKIQQIQITQFQVDGGKDILYFNNIEKGVSL